MAGPADTVRPTYYADTINGAGVALSALLMPNGQTVSLGSACYVSNGDGVGNPAVWTCELSTAPVDHANVEVVSGVAGCRWIRNGAFGGSGAGGVAYSADQMTASMFTVRDVNVDNTYGWEIETNTTPSTAANFLGGDQFNFGDGGCMRITAGGSGNQAFARIAGGGLGSLTSPGKFCQFLNPQALPLYLRVRFAMTSDTGSFNGVVWLVRVGSVTNGPSTALSNFGIAWNGNRQMLEIRSESALGSTQEYQIPLTFDHAQHIVEVFSDGALMAVRLDGVLESVTDVSNVGLFSAGATGVTLPIPLEMPNQPSFIDWGVNNIADTNANIGACWYGALSYGYIERVPMGSTR